YTIEDIEDLENRDVEKIARAGGITKKVIDYVCSDFIDEVSLAQAASIQKIGGHYSLRRSSRSSCVTLILTFLEICWTRLGEGAFCARSLAHFCHNEADATVVLPFVFDIVTNIVAHLEKGSKPDSLTLSISYDTVGYYNFLISSTINLSIS
ncbi:MAG: hypothetical protein ACREOB_03645, partial [Thermodesulfobacteriota bacterium]